RTYQPPSAGLGFPRPPDRTLPPLGKEAAGRVDASSVERERSKSSPAPRSAEDDKAGGDAQCASRAAGRRETTVMRPRAFPHTLRPSSFILHPSSFRMLLLLLLPLSLAWGCGPKPEVLASPATLSGVTKDSPTPKTGPPPPFQLVDVAA